MTATDGRRYPNPMNKREKMRKSVLVALAALTIGASGAKAQVDLSAYVDANGYLDVQKLTCAQLANTWQEDADKLMVWYSGWYNGLAKKHFFNVSRGVRLEHEVIVHCKANPDIRVIDAIAVILKDERVARGI
jgi:HdeA/HdeB family protein